MRVVYLRIEFDQSVKSKLRLTLEDMRKKLFESQRDDGMYNNNRWMVDFRLQSQQCGQYGAQEERYGK